MYADQISTGRKRSIHDRLDADLPSDRGGADAAGRARNALSKRQRQTDDKWKHDLYRDDESASRSVDPRDLRFKLQKKSSQQGFAGQKGSGVRDLREMLSGTMHAQPSNVDPQKRKPVSEVVKVTRREIVDERPVRLSKKVSKPSTSKKTSQPKHFPWITYADLDRILRNPISHCHAESPLDSFLKSLGLEKYSITFQAEEVDMAALRHMTESDLKALGIPMWICRLLHPGSVSALPCQSAAKIGRWELLDDCSFNLIFRECHHGCFIELLKSFYYLGDPDSGESAVSLATTCYINALLKTNRR
ncbi:unnamed protein product [Triticum turgidum subsp. durum]|uniref:SAM domain-containing protein n=1 Tax=Triticum turgidum subsp. durum TaxID=4567 RepID=A0A9R1R847_TRITD|nr:unnamed protein product [Triticum turgidum subsp. durum]